MQTGSGISGTVLEKETGMPVPGALVLVSDPNISAVTDKEGKFSLSLKPGAYELRISFIGFRTIQQTVEVLSGMLPLTVALETEEIGLDQVEVLSTGYQQIPKERATGSFAFLDQELVDRRVSTSVLDRLEDVTPGLIFNRAGAINDPISIRGRSTLFGNTLPLIVIDNLPYEGPIENINPNDVASITVLKDAAAASIWGAQAGNGVIVITTKSGKFNQPIQVSLQSNLTRVEQQDLFYQPLMGMGDFIEQERNLFNTGFYNARITNAARLPVSPVVETLLAARSGLISGQEATARLSQFAMQDSREELSKYYYRPAVRQQHAVQVSGGGDKYRFNYSAGLDSNLEDIRGNGNRRITLNARQDWRLLNGKLDIATGIALVRSDRRVSTALPNLYPYEKLTDGEGNAVPVVGLLHSRFVESTVGSELLDWRFIPLEEINRRNENSTAMDWRANLGLSYKLRDGLTAQVQNQFWNNQNTFRHARQSFLSDTQRRSAESTAVQFTQP